MNNLKIFQNESFGQVRTIEVSGKILFCGKDVASALGYTNTNDALQRHCKTSGVAFHDLTDNLGRIQKAKFINEGNLYRLISNSDLPSAEKFESWVFDEVLPLIRKTGSYQVPKSPIELLQLTQQAILEVNTKVDTVEKDLQNFKMDMPILGLECDRITTAVKRKGVECLGGKTANAYQDKSLRNKIYSDIYGQLKREFDITTYKAIKRSQSDLALSIINNYKLPLVLSEQVYELNQQMQIS